MAIIKGIIAKNMIMAKERMVKMIQMPKMMMSMPQNREAIDLLPWVHSFSQCFSQSCFW